MSLKALDARGVVFSMIQPTGSFHLGNYLGANKSWKQIQDKKIPGQKLIFGVADLHAITVPQLDVAKFKKQRLDCVASILSLGIDPEQSTIMYQSMIPEHSQLNWLLGSISSMGYLNRMTQWKSKSKEKNHNLGLFAYPVLQAADILLYGTTHVPVGQDQLQHLELTRHLARKFNSMFKTELFVEPEPLLTATQRVSSLKDPRRKMSKSDSDQSSVIFLNDDPDVIRNKIKASLTDSEQDRMYYDLEKRPGVSNLISIASGLQNRTVEDVVTKDLAHMHDFNTFKTYVSDVVIEQLAPVRKRYHLLQQDPGFLESVVVHGSLNEARPLAKTTLHKAMEAMGLD